MEKLEGRSNEKCQKRKPSWRTNGVFMNDVLSRNDMKIEHIRKAIDTQMGVMVEIAEKQAINPYQTYIEHLKISSKPIVLCMVQNAYCMTL